MTHVRNYLLYTALAALFYVTTTSAVTEQWAVNLESTFVYDIWPDGSGGVAFVVADSAGYRVQWLNKKGEVIYSVASSELSKIIAVNKKGFVYFRINGTGYILVTVDAKGNVKIISDPENNLKGNEIGGIPTSLMSDAKGFFAYKQNKVDNNLVLVRYSYK